MLLTVREKCKKCRWKYANDDKWHYHYMKLTNWLPPRGIEQRQREFKCPFCHNIFYRTLSIKEFEKIGEYHFL